MTPEQVAAVKDGLAAQASAQNSIVGGASSPEASDAKNLGEILCKSVADKFYKRG